MSIALSGNFLGFTGCSLPLSSPLFHPELISKQIAMRSRPYQFQNQTNPQAICQALQELGPTFIKLGQILSTRPDLVSPAYIKELRHLQDQVKADSFATVEQTFEEETGKKINDEFASFAEKPFASASIGQVHHATLKDGTPVVVKVQHPEVGKLVSTDLALLRKAVVLFKYVPQDIAINILR